MLLFVYLLHCLSFGVCYIFVCYTDVFLRRLLVMDFCLPLDFKLIPKVDFNNGRCYKIKFDTLPTQDNQSELLT